MEVKYGFNSLLPESGKSQEWEVISVTDVEMKAIGVKSVLDFPTKQGMVLTMVVEVMEAMVLLVVAEVVQVVEEVDL